MEDEWMTRLSSYYEHLVQPGRSVLGKRNYFGPKFVNWLTRLCATQTISSGVMRTQCVLQIPKACKKNSLACSLRWRVDVSVALPIIFCTLFALFGLRCLRCRGYGMSNNITGFPLPSRCGPSNYRTVGLLLQWKYSDTADAIWPGPRQNRQIWRDWNNNSNVNKFQCGWTPSGTQVPTFKAGRHLPWGVF